MSPRKRLRWPWWVGGIIVVLGVLAYVDFKFVEFAVSRTDAELYPGAIGTVQPHDIACFPSSASAGTFVDAAWRRDMAAQQNALRAATFVRTGAHVQGLAFSNVLNTVLFVRVLDGVHGGRTCWIATASQFSDIRLASVTTQAVGAATEELRTCADPREVDKIVGDLREFDATTDASTRTRVLAEADQLIGDADQDVLCRPGQDPDDFELATAWSAADDVRQEQAQAGPHADPCRLDSERDELTSAWMAVYDHQETQDRAVLEGTLSSIRATASSVSLTLPPLSIDEGGASRFQADQKARADARDMGLPC